MPHRREDLGREDLGREETGRDEMGRAEPKDAESERAKLGGGSEAREAQARDSQAREAQNREAQNRETQDREAQVPVAERPLTKRPVTKRPVTERPVTERPVTEPPVADNPVALGHEAEGLANHAGATRWGEKQGDADLRQGIEAMFFAYRGFTADPDRILATLSYGRAHHRALHFIHGAPGTNVNNLLAILGVTKQSLNRVLRTLIEDGLVESRVGQADKRERHLFLTEAGAALERRLSDAQRARMRLAYDRAGAEAVAGFRAVLEAMMDPDLKRHYARLKEGRG